MKTGILSILILALFGLNNESLTISDKFECSITSSKKVYKRGETPEITVAITNNSEEDIFLIGSLDGSDCRWRGPFCYFAIEKPKAIPNRGYGRCGNMNPLRKQDFVFIKSGESFNPYQSVDHSGFFNDYKIRDKNNFLSLGKYKITFYYSTKSTKLEAYLGDGRENDELKELFSKVPNIELESNTLEIEIK